MELLIFQVPFEGGVDLFQIPSQWNNVIQSHLYRLKTMLSMPMGDEPLTVSQNTFTQQIDRLILTQVALSMNDFCTSLPYFKGKEDNSWDFCMLKIG